MDCHENQAKLLYNCAMNFSQAHYSKLKIFIEKTIKISLLDIKKNKNKAKHRAYGLDVYQCIAAQ